VSSDPESRAWGIIRTHEDPPALAMVARTGPAVVLISWQGAGWAMEAPAGDVRAEDVGRPVEAGTLNFVHLGDLDGDERVDLVVSGMGHHNLWSHDPATAAGPLDAGDPALVISEADAGLMLWDWAGQGQLDLVVNQAGGPCWLLGPLGTGTRSIEEEGICFRGGALTLWTLGDADGDGHLDLLTKEPLSTRALLIPGPLEGRLDPSMATSVIEAGYAFPLRHLDLDGDGDVEVVFEESDRLWAFDAPKGELAEEDAEWTLQLQEAPYGAEVAVRSGDLNGDGFPDLIRQAGHHITVHYGPFEPGEHDLLVPDEYLVVHARFNQTTVFVADVDEDGKDSLVLSMFDSDAVADNVVTTYLDF
jgi:hypothetical protein